jgi:hypothetical protein
MYITTPENFDVLWEGTLETHASFSRGLEGVKASIGTPVQWMQGQVLDKKWNPPGNFRFYLIRLAFSLRPIGREVVTSASFSIQLSSENEKKPIIYDGYPREQNVEQKDSVTLNIAPEIKLQEVGASLGKLETNIDFGKVIPVIHTEGLQESVFTWYYRAHPKFPLIGSRSMYAIVAIPSGMVRTMATFTLEASYEDHFGPIRLSTPENERRRLRWLIGDTTQ